MPTTVIPIQRPIGAAFVGGGFMAEVHSRASRAARAALVGGASSSLDSAQRAAISLGFERAYATPDELFADSAVDVVHVCTPNATHLEYALAALDAGKNVICEKPLATSVADAELLADRAAAAGVTATVPFVYRYHPMVREARARVASGLAGAVLTIQGAYLQDWLLSDADDDWRVDAAQGGPSRAFADIGSHLCDLVEFVTGDRIARLAATKRTIYSERARNRDIATEDAVAVVVETTTGAIGTLLVSQVAPGRKNRLSIEINGSAESIVFDQEQPESLWLGRRQSSGLLMRDAGQLSPDAQRLSILPAGHPLGYQDAFNAFVADSYAAARGKRPEGLPTFDDGLRAVRLTAAVLESSIHGGWVDVPAFETVVTA
jgi:predicted dehydrogenase